MRENYESYSSILQCAPRVLAHTLVVDTPASADGKVRHVQLRYCTPNNTQVTVDRAVQRLILLVPVDSDSE